MRNVTLRGGAALAARVWLTVLKVTLAGYLAIGLAVVVIVFIRRSPEVKFRQEPDGSLQTSEPASVAMSSLRFAGSLMLRR